MSDNSLQPLSTNAQAQANEFKMQMIEALKATVSEDLKGIERIDITLINFSVIPEK